MLRQNIKNLIPYSSARNEFMEAGNILLDANELPYNEPFNRYPDPYQQELKNVLSKRKNRAAENIFLGNGSDECLDLLVRSYCEPKRDNIITVSPSYGMYDVISNINDIELRKVNLKDDFQLNTGAILNQIDQNTSLIILCNPNNPTANSFYEKDILFLLEHFKGLVIIDEAYVDFSTKESFQKYLDQYDHLVLVQTLSKSYGLAGLRLGIVLASSEIVSILNTVKYPYNINSLTLKEALKQLHNGNHKNWLKETSTQKATLVFELAKLDIVKRIYESDTNFILIKFHDSQKVYQYLKDQKIIVRDRSQHPLTLNCLRITVGNKSENELLIKTLMQLEYEESNIS